MPGLKMFLKYAAKQVFSWQCHFQFNLLNLTLKVTYLYLSHYPIVFPPDQILSLIDALPSFATVLCKQNSCSLIVSPFFPYFWPIRSTVVSTLESSDR